MKLPPPVEEEPFEEESPLDAVGEEAWATLSTQDMPGSGSAGIAGGYFSTRVRMPQRQAGRGFDEVATEPNKKGGHGLGAKTLV